MGDRLVHAAVEYQVCDDRTCDLPQQVAFDLVLREPPSVE